ncbi:agamous-like MADS-box protein AGL30 [Tasmannia lanceolata]|uniref:agamous-like MADS-box protein AGL30 n=1 Tax=Tasmannia lanceolata TaxID=3420 RepID=UPI0040630F53
MGRLKLKIERLESYKARQTAYTKRKIGFTKKASELSVLCDVDVALVMFSPTGKPTTFVGKNSDLTEVIERFSNVSIQERNKRKFEMIEGLAKTFEKVGHNVDVKMLMCEWQQRTEEVQDQKKILEERIQKRDEKLSPWANQGDIDDADQLTIMEDSIVDSLKRLRRRKGNLEAGRAHRALVDAQVQFFPRLRANYLVNGQIYENPNLAIAQCNLGSYANAAANIGNVEMRSEFGFQNLPQLPNYNLIGLDQQLEPVLGPNMVRYNHVPEPKPNMVRSKDIQQPDVTWLPY